MKALLKILLISLCLILPADILSSCEFSSGGKDTITDMTSSTEKPDDEITAVTTAETSAVVAPVSIKDIPEFTGGGNKSNYDCGGGVYMRYVTLAIASDYTAYLTKLSNEGFTQISYREIKNNKFAEYVKGTVSIYTYFIPSEGSVRVIVSPYTPVKTEETGPKKVDATITHVGLNYTSVENGMSYILRTQQGSFIVIDGGWEGQGEAKKILALLNEQNTNGGLPRVAAWIVTHPHSDHLGAIAEFATLYYDKIILDRVIYNFVNDDIMAKSDSKAMISSSSSIYNRLRNTLKKAWKNTEIVKPHSGQLIKFDGVEMDVLMTHEDVYPKLDSLEYMNATSLVFTLELGGKRIAILGDASRPMLIQATNRYGDHAKSDFLQPTHHGSTHGYIPFYENISPTICLWPTSSKRLNEYINEDYNKFLLNNKKIIEHHLSSDGTKTFVLG